MGSLWKKALVAAFVMVSGPMASAEIAFAPSLYLNTEKTKVNGSETSDNRWLIVDFRMGYIFSENGLYLGGMYKMENDAYRNGDLSGYAVGPSVGYVNGGFSLIATYHAMAERKITSSGTEVKYSSGSGFQVDVAYTPQIASNFGLGPVFSYRDTKYSKTKVGGAAETSDSFQLSGLTPGFMFFFKF